MTPSISALHLPLRILLVACALLAVSAHAQVPPERPSIVRVDTPEGDSYYFRSVAGITADVQVTEFRSGGEPGPAVKLPGAVRYPNIVLRRGYVAADGFWQWSEQVRSGLASKKNIKIALIDLRGSVIVQFNVYNSFPAVWTVSNDNLGNRAVEEFAIVTEGVELVR
jgi:phage tail-like protein